MMNWSIVTLWEDAHFGANHVSMSIPGGERQCMELL